MLRLIKICAESNGIRRVRSRCGGNENENEDEDEDETEGVKRTGGAVSLCGGSMYSASVKDKGQSARLSIFIEEKLT